jgi:WD40 repeat protein
MAVREHVAALLLTLAAVPAWGGEPAKPDGGQPVRLDRHGDPLPPGALARIGTVRLWQGTQITAPLVWTPDGKTLAACGYDGVIRLWDQATGKQVSTFRGPREGVFALAVSPDGRWLAAGSRDDVAVWRLDADPPGEARRPAGADDGAGDLAFSPDGKLLAAYGKDRGIHLWETAGWREVGRIGGPGNGQLYANGNLGFFPDGKSLVCANTDGTIRVWEVATGKLLRTLAEKRRLWGIALSPDGKVLAAVEGRSNTLRHLDAATGREVSLFQGEDHSCYCFAVSPDSRSVATAGASNEVRIWDAATGKERHRWACPQFISRIAFSPDGKTLAVGGSGMIRFRSVASGREVAPVPALPGEVVGLAFSADGDTLATGSVDGSVGLWDAKTGAARVPVRGGPAADVPRGRIAWNTAVARGGKVAASLDEKGAIHLWQGDTGRELPRLSEPPATDSPIVLSPDGRALVAVHTDGALRLWETETGKVVCRIACGKDAWVRAVSPGGRRVAAKELDGTVRLWDIPTGKELPRIHPPWGSVTCMAFSPDGKLLAAGGAGHPGQTLAGEGMSACVWEADTGREFRQLKGPLPGAWSLAFSPDGRALAAGTGGGGVWLWEMASGQVCRHWEGSCGMVYALAFSPDGRRLASGNTDHTALVWDVTGLAGPDGRLGAVVLSAERLEKLWADLADPDAAVAHTALWTLAASPAAAVPALAVRLKPVAAPEPRRLARLLADLDSDSYPVRVRAADDLGELGELAEPALRKALGGALSVEARRRIEQLLERLGGPVQAPEELRALRAVQALEQAGTPEARRLLQTLAEGAAGARLTREAKAALDRLAAR